MSTTPAPTQTVVRSGPKGPPQPPRPMPAHFRQGVPAEAKPAPPVPLDRYVDLGDPVFWFPGADPLIDPMVGIVTGIGIGTIDCNVFTSSLHNTVPQEAAMHMDDPAARTDRNQGGGWRHQPLVLATRKLLFAAGIIRWNGKDKYEVVPGFDFNALAKSFIPAPAFGPAAGEQAESKPAA